MAGFDVNSDIESDSDSVLELDISLYGAICPFVFEPQHCSFSSSIRPFLRSLARSQFFRFFVHSFVNFPASLFFPTFGLTTMVSNEICSF